MSGDDIALLRTYVGLCRLALDETLDDVAVDRVVELLEVEQHEQGRGQSPHVIDDRLQYCAHRDNDLARRLVHLRWGGRPDESRSKPQNDAGGRTITATGLAPNKELARCI